MKFCWFLRSVMFAVRSLGRFLGRGVCLVTAESGQSRFFEKLAHFLAFVVIKVGVVTTEVPQSKKLRG